MSNNTFVGTKPTISQQDLIVFHHGRLGLCPKQYLNDIYKTKYFTTCKISKNAYTYKKFTYILEKINDSLHSKHDYTFDETLIADVFPKLANIGIFKTKKSIKFIYRNDGIVAPLAIINNGYILFVAPICSDIQMPTL